MKLSEVIEHLNDCMSETDKILFPEVFAAHRIGIEAVKRHVQGRHGWASEHFPPLPGETEE